jgi:hypothetical protein
MNRRAPTSHPPASSRPGPSFPKETANAAPHSVAAFGDPPARDSRRTTNRRVIPLLAAQDACSDFPSNLDPLPAVRLPQPLQSFGNVPRPIPKPALKHQLHSLLPCLFQQLPHPTCVDAAVRSHRLRVRHRPVRRAQRCQASSAGPAPPESLCTTSCSECSGLTYRS